jgi:hypothetical protein
MDIFDTFFLVEFLRQWAATAGSSGPAAVTPSGKFAVTTIYVYKLQDGFLDI